MLGKDYADQDCNLARALEVVGERWTLLVLRDAFYGIRRFSDFATRLDIPRAVLADRLRHLVEAGLLERRPDPGRAGRDVYELTESGRDLWPALHALIRWGSRFDSLPGPPRQFRHAACDTALDQRGACLQCGAVPPPEDILTIGRGTPVRKDPVTVGLLPPRRLLQPFVLDRAAAAE